MTYYLKESEWYQSIHIPEGMNLDMINQPNRLSEVLLPAIDLVEPNKIFLDMGCGTGLLGLYALDKGAKFVYFVELDTQMFHILENVLTKKLDPSKFKLINKDIESLSIEDFSNGLPEIAVSEFYGPRLFDEGYVNYTKHVRSLAPKCYFIPETFMGDFYIADVDYTQGIWPIDQQLVDHYKFMYKSKGFAKYIAFPKNAVPIGKILFDANKQEFINSFNFTFNDYKDKLLYGRMSIHHGDLIQHYTSIGWFLDESDYNKNFKIYFDIDNNFNPRLIVC